MVNKELNIDNITWCIYMSIFKKNREILIFKAINVIKYHNDFNIIKR